jgi:hypothetical protein
MSDNLVKTRCLVVLSFVICGIGTAQGPTPKKPDWTPLKFLAGHWNADPNPNEPGATGSSDFRFDLDGSILVRDNRADYPPQNGKPALHHRDLMVIYAVDSSGLKATYWDNEPHTIYYDVTVGAPGEVSFVTYPDTRGPRFRLLYKRISDTSVSGHFDIAAPGGEFKTYRSWTMHRG